MVGKVENPALRGLVGRESAEINQTSLDLLGIEVLVSQRAAMSPIGKGHPTQDANRAVLRFVVFRPACGELVTGPS